MHGAGDHKIEYTWDIRTAGVGRGAAEVPLEMIPAPLFERLCQLCDELGYEFAAEPLREPSTLSETDIPVGSPSYSRLLFDIEACLASWTPSAPANWSNVVLHVPTFSMITIDFRARRLLRRATNGVIVKAEPDTLLAIASGALNTASCMRSGIVQVCPPANMSVSDVHRHLQALTLLLQQPARQQSPASDLGATPLLTS